MIQAIEIFRKALDSAPEPIVICDETGIILYCNSSFCKQLEYHKLEVLKNPIGNFVPTSFLEKLNEILNKKIADKDLKEIRYEKLLETKNGQLIWFTVESRIMPTESGNLWVSFYRNELKNKKQQAQFQDIVKKLNDFSFLTSHKLRHPIANLLGLVNLFDTENLSNPENLSLINFLKQSAFQLNEVVHELNHTLNSSVFSDELSMFNQSKYPGLIMLVDDDSINHFITKSVIARVNSNIKVLAFTDPKEALKYLELNKQLPDLILLELGLKWMTEWDFLRNYQDMNLSKIPCYIFRNFIETIDKNNRNNFEVFRDFIMKPITTEKLNTIFDQ